MSNDEQEFKGLPSRFKFHIATTALMVTEEFGLTEFATYEEAQKALDKLKKPNHYFIHKVEIT
jgi:hypothetical protein